MITKKKSDLRDKSRVIDVHKSSEWHEVNPFINGIYAAYISGSLTTIQKKNLKVLLLDLYVAWTEGYKYIGMSFDDHKYKPKSRYNALHISKKIIECAKKLSSLNLIRIHKGYYDKVAAFGYVSRIEPTENLISLFKQAKFPDLAISYELNRETVELKDDQKNLIDYKETNQTYSMRNVLTAYNELLKKTHIDCCHLKSPRLNRSSGRSVNLSQHSKFTKRVFNDRSWKKGGRFYGGFWQQIPSDDRQFIRINGERTVEIDYSGLHVVLLYAQKGINYWEDVGDDDPYSITVAGLSKGEARSLGKLLLLMAINAKDEKKAYDALRSEVNSNEKLSFNVKLTNELLSDALSQLKQRHPKIADKLSTGVGICLQNVDSRITEALIKSFTKDDIPLLAIHDSYIVPHQYKHDLLFEMEKAFIDHSNVDKYLKVDADVWPKEMIKVKQKGYDDEYLADLDSAPNADPAYNEEVFAQHQKMVEYIESHVCYEYRQRLEKFRADLEILDQKKH